MKLFKLFNFFILMIFICLTPVVLFAAEGGESIWRLLFNWGNAGEILAVISILALSIVGAKFRQLVKEITEAIKAYTDAKAEDSPGGAEVTAEEKAKIMNESLDVVKEALNIWATGFTKPAFWTITLLKRMLGKK